MRGIVKYLISAAADEIDKNWNWVHRLDTVNGCYDHKDCFGIWYWARQLKRMLWANELWIWDAIGCIS